MKPQRKQWRDIHPNIQEPLCSRTLQCGCGLPPSTMGHAYPTSNNRPQTATANKDTPITVCLCELTWRIQLHPHTT